MKLAIALSAVMLLTTGCRMVSNEQAMREYVKTHDCTRGKQTKGYATWDAFSQKVETMPAWTAYDCHAPEVHLDVED